MKSFSDTKFILASGSPRRKELLAKIVPHFDVITADIKEFTEKTKPYEIVMDLAQQKCKAVEDLVASQNSKNGSQQETIIIASDTLVFFEDKVLGKPRDEKEARQMLRSLNDKWHEVYTGVAIAKLGNAAGHSTFYDKTRVKFCLLSFELIDYYIATGSPMDKAGAYGIQDLDGALVEKIDGSYDNVMGLPTEKLAEALESM